MKQARFTQFWLTCANAVEATKIAQVLLERHLVACAKQVLVSADFIWKDEIDHNDEVLLIMDSREDLFEEVEAEVKKLHSYETFVLQAIPVLKVSDDAVVWLNESLKG